MGEIKRYQIMNKQYHGTPEQLHEEINVITGLVNFKLEWALSKNYFCCLHGTKY